MRLRVLVDDRSTWRDLLVDVGPDHTVAELTAAVATHLELDAATNLDCESTGTVDPALAVADSGLRWGDRLALTTEPARGDGPAVPLRRLVVESGPDAGRQLSLPEGGHDIGRAPAMALPIDDPHLSRRHLRIEVAATGVTVADLGSSNGTAINDRRVTDAERLRPDDVVVAGASLLRLRPPPPPPTTRTARDGRVAFQRPPRLDRPAPVPTVRMPAPGSGGLLRGALAAARTVLGRVPDEPGEPRGAVYGDHPGPRTLIDRARFLRSTLWERRPDDDDFLDLRIGWGTASGPSPVPRTPLVVGLDTAGSLAIACSDDHVRRRVLRWQVAQLAGLHSPCELRLAVVGDPVHEWDWATWLPHAAAVGGPEIVTGPEATALVGRLTDLTTARRARADRDDQLHIVLAVGDDPSTDAGAIEALVRDGPAAGVHVLWAGRGPAPEGIGADLEVDPVTGRGTLSPAGGGQAIAVDGVDGLRTDVALELGLALAGVRDVTTRAATTALPQTVTLLDLLDLPDPHGAALRDRWDRAGHGLTMTLGAAATGPLVVDLADEGPHALLGGVDADAVDEVVRSLEVALASHHPPGRLRLHLLDVAGRGIHRDCVDLPHAVTHAADAGECETALAALIDELDRRRALLDDAAAADLAALEARGAADALARVVVVVAGADQVTPVLAGQLDQLLDAAALGVHVVVATADPAATAALLPAIPGIRIALRTGGPSDDEVLLGAGAPARREGGPPGRGRVRIGHGPVQEFQAGTVTATAEASDRPETVAVHDVVGGRPAPGRSTTTIARERVAPTSDLTRLVAACRAAGDAIARDRTSLPDPPPATAVNGAEVERTFLFSDVVRSTALVDAIGDEHWLRLVQWHDQALVELVEGHGGEVVDHTGDGFFVAFLQPAPALACAVDIQRMLHRHRIEAGFAPEVRIGVHHTTVRHDGRYRGRGVHVAARIAALATGGEVLASAATVALVPDVATGPTRTEELRGISTPVPVASVRLDS